MDAERACEKEIYERLAIADSDGHLTHIDQENIKILEDEGRLVKNIETGSLTFDVFCPTEKSLEHLWNLYCSKYLRRHFNKVLAVEEIKQKHNVKDMFLNVTISEPMYKLCKKEINSKGEYQYQYDIANYIPVKAPLNFLRF